MNTELQNAVRRMASSLEALLRVQTKVSDMIGSDEVKISKARAREFLLELNYINAGLERRTKEPSYFNRLDRMEQMSKAEAAELAGCAE
jgi:hypothetical protein